jgi:hypothetical protein
VTALVVPSGNQSYEAMTKKGGFSIMMVNLFCSLGLLGTAWIMNSTCQIVRFPRRVEQGVRLKQAAFPESFPAERLPCPLPSLL